MFSISYKKWLHRERERKYPNNTPSTLYKSNNIGIFDPNPSKSMCFHVQSVTCCDLSDFFNRFEVYSIDSSKMMGNFPEVLNFNHLFSQTQPVQYVTSSHFSPSLKWSRLLYVILSNQPSGPDCTIITIRALLFFMTHILPLKPWDLRLGFRGNTLNASLALGLLSPNFPRNLFLVDG